MLVSTDHPDFRGSIKTRLISATVRVEGIASARIMSPPILAPPAAESVNPERMDSQRRPSDREELRQNIAQLKLGEECLRRKRLLGGACNQDYETYSLPVSRVRPPILFLVMRMVLNDIASIDKR